VLGPQDLGVGGKKTKEYTGRLARKPAGTKAMTSVPTEKSERGKEKGRKSQGINRKPQNPQGAVIGQETSRKLQQEN